MMSYDYLRHKTILLPIYAVSPGGGDTKLLYLTLNHEALFNLCQGNYHRELTYNNHPYPISSSHRSERHHAVGESTQSFPLRAIREHHGFTRQEPLEKTSFSVPKTTSSCSNSFAPSRFSEPSPGGRSTTPSFPVELAKVPTKWNLEESLYDLESRHHLGHYAGHKISKSWSGGLKYPQPEGSSAELPVRDPLKLSPRSRDFSKRVSPVKFFEREFYGSDHQEGSQSFSFQEPVSVDNSRTVYKNPSERPSLRERNARSSFGKTNRTSPRGFLNPEIRCDLVSNFEDKSQTQLPNDIKPVAEALDLFLRECCQEQIGCIVSRNEIQKAYEKWRLEKSQIPIAGNVIAEYLNRRYETVRKQKKIYYHNLSLKMRLDLPEN